MAPGEAPDPRLSFEELMELAELPLSPEAAAGGVARRFMSRRPANLPGSDIEEEDVVSGPRGVFPNPPVAAFGGHVFCQAAVAVGRVASEEEDKQGAGAAESRHGLHTIHGYFTVFGLTDRPFIYDVEPITTGRSFVTYAVKARQPIDRESSFSPGGEHGSLLRFPAADPDTTPVDSDLGPVCFSAMVSLKLPEPHCLGLTLQEPPPQARFAGVLSSRPRLGDWPLVPRLDMQGIVDGLGPAGADVAGTFPAVEMRKVVDMAAYSAARPMHEKRELVLYRLLGPMPAGDPNMHALVHAFVGDRNGLLMAANFMGLGSGGARLITTLSNTFVVHTNAEDAVMHRGGGERDPGGGGAGDRGGWWIYEVTYPRVANGRVVLEGKIWSPEGVHVATVYQDGIVRAMRGLTMDAKEREKL
ncbi:hypothetical protein RB595_008384 [Gaeumannomyces hyphopodioides]